jgi:hypothetical protein
MRTSALVLILMSSVLAVRIGSALADSCSTPDLSRGTPSAAPARFPVLQDQPPRFS